MSKVFQDTDAVNALGSWEYGKKTSDGVVTWEFYDSEGNSIEKPSDFPTEAQITAKIAEMKADWEAKQYQRDRQYPTIAEQLDMQYWDGVNGTTTWADAIAAVKAANPKPAE